MMGLAMGSHREVKDVSQSEFDEAVTAVSLVRPCTTIDVKPYDYLLLVATTNLISVFGLKQVEASFQITDTEIKISTDRTLIYQIIQS